MGINDNLFMVHLKSDVAHILPQLGSCGYGLRNLSSDCFRGVAPASGEGVV